MADILNQEATEQAVANDQSTSRLRLGELGSESMAAIADITQRLAPIELKWPQCLQTYEKMKQDATVAAALNASYIQIEKRFAQAQVLSNPNSEKSKQAAEFVRWCFNNMDVGTLRSVARNAATFKECGFSILEKCYTKIQSGKYKGGYKLKKLGLRPALSLYKSEPFVFSGQGRDIAYCQQDPNYFKNSVSGGFGWMTQTAPLQIERKKFMLFGYNVTDDRPFGYSPLNGAFVAWREKTLIASYETVGVAKDLGGLPVFRLPISVMEKAALDPSSPEAASVKAYMQQMANLHAGEQAFIMLPSDLQTGSTSQLQYDFTLKGVDGGSKSFNTKDLINERKKAILDVFGAGFLAVGQDTTGSNGLAESKNGIHSLHIDHDCKIIEEVINHDLIPQLLAMNEILLPDEDLPKVESGYAEDPDLEGISKMIQRVTSVGLVPKTVGMLEELWAMMGIKYRVPDDVRDDEDKFLEWRDKFLSDNTSRAGDGMTTAFEGTSKGGGTSRDNSVANNEN